jgi:short-subunit dehydrogenase
LVTGASSGIGRAIATRLASEGTDLILASRAIAVLEEVRDELTRDHDVRVDVVGADLSRPAGLQEVERRIVESDPPVGLVVNNAGFGTSGPFWELPVDEEVEEVAVNLMAVARLTHLALGEMVPRGSGAVLNIASLAGSRAAPYSATYGATKAYLLAFGDSVHEELVGSGVTLTTVLPGNTRSGFHARAAGGEEGLASRVPSSLWADPDEVAAVALAAAASGRARVVPGVRNLAVSVVLDVMPAAVSRRLFGTLARRSQRSAAPQA